jgi:hypothetical protein
MYYLAEILNGIAKNLNVVMNLLKLLVQAPKLNYLPVENVKIGMFGEMKLIAVSLFKMAHNVFGLGEVAEPNVELKNKT